MVPSFALSLRASIFCLSSGVTLLFFILFAVLLYGWEKAEEEQALNMQINHQAVALAHALRKPLREGNLPEIRRLIRSTLAYPDISAVAVYDRNGKTLVNQAGRGSVAPTERIKREIPDTQSNQRLGNVVLYISRDDLNHRLEELLRAIVLASICFMVLQLILLHFALHWLLGPVQAVTKTLQELALGETDLEIPAQNRQDEIGKMARAVAMLKKSAIQIGQLEERKTQAEEATRLKSQFLANMSHEIRTPMNAIIGMTSLLAEARLPPQESARIEVIRRSGEALLEIINDILDLSKIEAGKLEIISQPFPLRQLAAETRDLLASRAVDKRLALELEVDPSLPEWIAGDPGRVQQILLNLVGNAIKFTEKGSVRVTLERRGTLLYAAVRDTGIGIAPENQTKLFQIFTQADASTTRRFGGTGLGLAICKRLTEMMGGEIGLVSVPGEGSTFWFTLPLKAEAAPSESGAKPAPESASLAGMQVLVAEDNEVNQMMMRQMLKLLGCHAEIAANGREAAHLAAKRSYAVILMDCMMPEMNGYEATQAIREQERKTDRHTPIIALTAGALQGEREKCLAAGMDDYLSKPVRKQDLQALLEKWAPGRAA